jgi:hypothetical protein
VFFANEDLENKILNLDLTYLKPEKIEHEEIKQESSSLLTHGRKVLANDKKEHNELINLSKSILE